MIEINELKIRRDDLILEKRQLEARLGVIRNMIRLSLGRMPREKYSICCRSQAACARRLLDIETELLAIKRELQRLSAKPVNIGRTELAA